MIDPFVSVDWLREHAAEVVLADCRWYLDGRSGRDAYDGSHIPGAVFVDLDAALTRHADPAAAGRHPPAEPEDFAAAMGELGIGDEDIVVAYDDAGGVIAARLVWMLRATGHEAALLDGGLAAGGPERAPGPPPTPEPGHTSPPTGRKPDSLSGNRPTDFEVRPWPHERLATIEEAALAGASPDLVAIDARPAERFAGAPDDLDPRAGHIPGARPSPCGGNLAAGGGRLPLEERRARLGIEDASAGVSYCGSGVTACHNLLAM